MALSARQQDPPLSDVSSFSHEIPNVIFETVLAGEMSDDKTIPFFAEALKHFAVNVRRTK
jgi:hypothetical protein